MNSKSIKNFIIILSAPSGGGKSSVVKALLKSEKDAVLSISATTRKPRENEIEGKDYFFISQEAFDKKLKNDEFLETTEIYGNSYGTLKKFVEENLKSGKNILFDIDHVGAANLKHKLGDLALSIFLVPPSLEELKKRLEKRNQDSSSQISERLGLASEIIGEADKYDHAIVNEDLNLTVELVKQIIKAKKQ